MCNKLHKNSTPIKKEGTGWKVFTRECDSSKLGSWISNGWDTYSKDEDGWTHWKPELNKDGNGFCFLLDKKEAGKFYYDRYNVTKKIEYKGGLGHFEDFSTLGPDKPLNMALCTSFRIIED